MKFSKYYRSVMTVSSMCWNRTKKFFFLSWNVLSDFFCLFIIHLKISIKLFLSFVSFLYVCECLLCTVSEFFLSFTRKTYPCLTPNRVIDHEKWFFFDNFVILQKLFHFLLWFQIDMNIVAFVLVIWSLFVCTEIFLPKIIDKLWNFRRIK